MLSLSMLWKHMVEVVGGACGEYLAERLVKAGVPVGKTEEKLINFLREIQGWEEPSYVFANYSAVMEIRKLLIKKR